MVCPLIRTSRLPVVDWNDTPADLNGLVHFSERPNLVSAHVPSLFKRALLTRLEPQELRCRTVQFIVTVLLTAGCKLEIILKFYLMEKEWQVYGYRNLCGCTRSYHSAGPEKLVVVQILCQRCFSCVLYLNCLRREWVVSVLSQILNLMFWGLYLASINVKLGRSEKGGNFGVNVEGSPWKA